MKIPLAAQVTTASGADARPWLGAQHDSDIIFNLPYETPFLALNPSRVAEQYDSLTKALPESAVHLAMKCNSDEGILRAASELGCSFEIASFGELEILRTVGITDDVLFSNPVKHPADIARAHAAGVRRFAFDSVREANKLAELAPGSSVYVRLKTRAGESDVPCEGKFGVTVDYAAWLMEYAASVGLDPYGIAFHVGSQMTWVGAWEEAIAQAGAVMRSLNEKGIRITMLDMGGGFPVQYAGAPVPSIAAIGATIRRAVQDLPYPVQTVVEPGRFLMAPAGVAVATVIGIADQEDWVYLDAGAFNLFMEELETQNTLRYPVTDSRGQKMTRPRRLAGPTCDSQDKILDNVALSIDLEVGDRVCFWQAGAYTRCYATKDFNGLPVPSTYLLNNAI
jgi:ornithine decarboxylase